MKIQRIMPATTHSMKDALPLGTILTVKNVADQKYIVVGYDTSSVPHNYYAVPWPQGYMSEENMYLVGFDDIAKVLCRGGINEESRVFLQALDDVLNGR